MGIVSTITEQEQHEVFVGGCPACRHSTGVWSRTRCCAHSSCQDCGSETRGSGNYSCCLQQPCPSIHLWALWIPLCLCWIYWISFCLWTWASTHCSCPCCCCRGRSSSC